MTTVILLGLVVVGAIGITAGVVWARRRSRRKQSDFERLLGKDDAGTSRARAAAAGPIRRRSGRLSAADLLAAVRALRSRGAQWSEIIATINPGDDARLSQLLTSLRGPHQFAPHVALSVLEAACERVLASGQRASDIDALREAARQTDRITR